MPLLLTTGIRRETRMLALCTPAGRYGRRRCPGEALGQRRTSAPRPCRVSGWFEESVAGVAPQPTCVSNFWRFEPLVRWIPQLELPEPSVPPGMTPVHQGRAQRRHTGQGLPPTSASHPRPTLRASARTQTLSTSPAALHQDAVVEASDGQTGEPITLEIRNAEPLRAPGMATA